ncbi:hypothetical protein D0T50_10460 [Bacteroides sp. 214]|uniref:hypothetical protein n=1 Tax=Bacteroides sp. 214 TaxID=2302935 RepID=UPI0013D3C587|nr:hypothetical protein [Bacteroides sp. 214]NDW13312.1 hypothetical protein [Bacteroides sp. 214]
MKKIALLTAGIAAIMMTACQKDDNLPQEQQEKFTVIATMPQKADTRVTFEEIAGDPLSSLKVTWAAGDRIVDENRIDHTLAGGAGTTSATFNFDTEPTGGATFTYGTWKAVQSQNPSNPMGHLSSVHEMAGTYNATAKSIAFEHQTSVMRIALSGLQKSSDLGVLYIQRDAESLSINLNGNSNSTEADGTFVAWVSVDPEWLDGATELSFMLGYLDQDVQEYTHTFGTALVGNALKGKLLHCNINMETKTAITVGFGSDPTWLDPINTVPDGYTHMVYDAASFAALPTADANAIVIQMADITLTDEALANFAGKYNGNGHTITKASGSAFTTLTGQACITNTHMRGGAVLISTLGMSNKISKCSSIGAALVGQGPMLPVQPLLTLCSTDQTALINSAAPNLFSNCWYNGAAQSTSVAGDVWKEATKEMVSVTAAQLYVDGKIQWDYQP